MIYTSDSSHYCFVRLVVALCGIQALALPAYGSEACTLALDQAKSFSKAGSFELAERVLQNALSDMPKTGSMDAVELWNQMGEVHESEMRMEEAEQDYQRALRLNESSNSPSAIERAISFNNLGTILERRHQFAAAEIYFRRSLSLVVGTELDRVAVIGSVLTNLAMSLQRQGQYSEAAVLYERGLRQLKEQFGVRTAEYSSALRNFGLFKFETGSYLEALEIQRQAYDIETSLPFVRDSDKAVAMNNLALTLIELSSYSEAQSLLHSAIQLQRSSPKVDANMVDSLSNLGVLDQRTGRLAEAEKDQTEALKLALQTLSDSDPLIPTLWHNLGNTAVAQGRFKEARRLYGKAAAAWLKEGKENANYSATITSLGTLERKERHDKQARALYAKALRLDESLLGPNHPRVASDLCNVAIEMFSQRKFEEASQLFNRAEQIQEKAFGSQSMAVARTWRELGMVDVALKQFKEADRAYSKAIAISRQSAKDTSELMSWLFEYADVLRKEQKFGEAEEASVQAYGIHVRTVVAAGKKSASTVGASAFK